MTLRLLKIRANGCEKNEQCCTRANEIGAAYFGDWVDIEHAAFESVTLNQGDNILYYVNNLAFKTQNWLVKALQPLADKKDTYIMSTDLIPGLGGELKHCKPGDAFTLSAESTSDLTALHSGNETAFKFRMYMPTPLEKLFNMKKPYATQNGNRSFNVLFRGHDILYGDDYLTTRDGTFVFSSEDDNSLDDCGAGWNKSQADMYAMLSEHIVKEYPPSDKRRFLVQRAFMATFSRSGRINMPSVHCMRVWMILYCSGKHECGQGFLDVDSGPHEQLAAGDYVLPNKSLTAHGAVPFRRTGHPEFEAAAGSSSEHIGMFECWRLQVANAAGADMLKAADVLADNPGMISGQNPTLLQVGQALEHFTALLLEPQDDLHGNLHATLLRKTGIYLLETSWTGQQYGHTLLWDAERNFLCMGRTKPGSVEQHTIRPVDGDLNDPVGRLSEQYGYEFTVNQVYQIMIKTRRLSEVPLVAYDPPPLTERERRKEAKRKAWMTRETRSSKRARTKVTAHVPPSHGRAFSSDEDGDGTVQPAIDSIQEDALRAYAEQQTEEMLQRLLRENPAHASFADRLRELHAPVDGGQPELVKYGPHPKLDWAHPAIASYTTIVMEGFDFDPVSETTVANMTCPAMREMLARRGLPMTGNKATLRDRLLTGDPNKSKVYCKVRRKILTAVHNNINRFGEDGYGDKPDHMDPVEYWLSHLNPTIFNRID